VSPEAPLTETAPPVAAHCRRVLGRLIIMKNHATNRQVGTSWRSAVLLLWGLCLTGCLLYSQQDHESGHSIGKVSTNGELIVMELDEGALGSANLFDLTGHTPTDYNLRVAAVTAALNKIKPRVAA